ncbi:MAG: hypothetical protein B6U97_01635 [Candidatus Altiarchaeales archaeon ex4484_96]|nr:MAG: hypothetical protein B6U97_01635 [Candidatus Altiarchaeales archaeon ex4484_96]
MRLLGLDIGGANTKTSFTDGAELIKRSCYFPIWKKKHQLPSLLSDLINEYNPVKVGLTMSAELSDAFINKKEGVYYVLDSVESAFKGEIHVLSSDGVFISPDEAKANHMRVASANWAATSGYAAKRYDNGVLVDVGSTTTDIIPFRGGEVVALGKTDLRRLQCGELIYSGILRTNIATLTDCVPVDGVNTKISAEFFAQTADVYTILGLLKQKDYSSETPDGRGKSIKECCARIGRIVCADNLMLKDKTIKETAFYLKKQQIKKLSQAIKKISEKWGINQAYICGSGFPLGKEAATKAGLKAHKLEIDSSTALLDLLNKNS